MARPAPLSGFPEWLPEGRIVEQHVIDTFRRSFELWGFASIETRAAEPLDELLRKGEIDKEVYVLRRLHAAADEEDAGRQLGLHFDLTVPFARYVLENAGRERSSSATLPKASSACKWTQSIFITSIAMMASRRLPK